MIGFVYHEDYNKYDLGFDHPLIGDKPRKSLEFFQEKGMMNDIEIFTPDMATEKDLFRVHIPNFVNRIKELSKIGGMISFDTPVTIGIYDIARLATGGTKLAGQKLFEGFDCMVNPLAGFHHASNGYSSGFCFFNDIAVTVEYLRDTYKVKRFLIIDLDVHHANGTQDIYYDDPTVFLISFHQDGRTLYPGTGSIDSLGKNKGEGFTVNMPLPPGTGDTEYMHAFREIIPPLTSQFQPEVIVYQCGVDTHHSDPLANLELTHQIYYQLARYMSQLSADTCNKLLVLFGGGYNSTASILSYYNIMCGLLNNVNIIDEEKLPEGNQKHIVKLIAEVKKRIKSFWEI